MVLLPGCPREGIQDKLNRQLGNIRVIQSNCKIIAQEFCNEKAILDDASLSQEQVCESLRSTMLCKCSQKLTKPESLHYQYSWLLNDKIQQLNSDKDKTLAIIAAGQKSLPQLQTKMQELHDGAAKENVHHLLTKLETKLNDLQIKLIPQINELILTLKTIKQFVIIEQVVSICKPIWQEFDAEITIAMQPKNEVDHTTELHAAVLLKCDESGYTIDSPTVNYPYLKYKTLLEDRITTVMKQKKNLTLSIAANSKITAYKQQIESNIETMLNALTKIKRFVVTSDVLEKEKKQFAAEQVTRDVIVIKKVVQQLQEEMNGLRHDQRDNVQSRQTIAQILIALQVLTRNNNNAQIMQSLQNLRIEISNIAQRVAPIDPPPYDQIDRH